MRQELATIGFNMPAMTPALPEILVLTMACVILIVELFLTDSTRVITYLMSLATLMGAALLTYSLHSEQPVLTFSCSFVGGGGAGGRGGGGGRAAAGGGGGARRY